MKKPIRVAVTGPAGNIGYSLLFRIAAGDMFGPDQPVILQLLDRASPESQQKVTGVMMELDDCAFPLLAGLENSPEATTAFRDADVALLVGARPRSKGMERADLLNANAEICRSRPCAQRSRLTRLQGARGRQPLQYQCLDRHEERSGSQARKLHLHAAS